jgi:cobalt/nickel transport protein
VRRLPLRVLAAIALLVALLLAGVVSTVASSEPDGLSRVAEDQGISRTEKDHAAEDSPLSGYAVRGVGDDRVSTGLAGVLGVGVVLLLGTGLAYVVRRREPSDDRA